MNTSRFELLRTSELQWLPELGIGWYPVTEQPYDASYWHRYRALDRTPTGEALTALRLELVRKHWGGDLVDVGIGGGRFVEERMQQHVERLCTWGFDVNPLAVEWLHGRAAYLDPSRNPISAATFWDSLEHIHDPAPVLANISRFAFVSLPIFTGPEHVLRSKHYRRDEHCWYFTRDGFARFMRSFGFELVEHNFMEQAAGREDIETFVFKRETT